MTTFLTVLYVLVCLFLITVVLLQAGRGGGMGAAFGGSSQTVFGGAGAGNFLTRLTVIMAALFMILSATLAYLSSSSEKALERASEAMRLREEAVMGGGAAGSGTAEEAPASTPEDVPSAVVSDAAAPMDEPLEGESESALEVLDQALAKPSQPGSTESEQAKPAESGATKAEVEAEPANDPEAGPKDPEPAPTPDPQAPGAPAN